MYGPLSARGFGRRGKIEGTKKCRKIVLLRSAPTGLADGLGLEDALPCIVQGFAPMKQLTWFPRLLPMEEFGDRLFGYQHKLV